MRGKRTYLDWAASAPVTPAALRAGMRATALPGNPSAPHAEGRAARLVLEDARRVIARMAEAKPEHVTFTASATEANNLAIQGYMRALRASGVQSLHVLVTAGAHASITETLKPLAGYGATVEEVSVRGGAVDIAAFKQQIRPDTVLVCAEAVSSETGARYDTRALRRTLDASSMSRVPLLVDASQLPFEESFEWTRLGADFLTLDAQKVGGVRGSAVLIHANNFPLAPVTLGGGQEAGLRSGTPAHAAASAFAVALTECAKQKDAFTARAIRMRTALIRQIQAAIPDALVNEGKENIAHILNVSFPGRDTDYVVALLDEQGFAVSTRSSCETDAVEGSRAVMAMTGDSERAKATVRISWGRGITENDLKRFGSALIAAIAFLDQNKLR